MEEIDDDDDSDYGGLYENGHWVWSDKTEEVVFVSELPEPTEPVQATSKLLVGNIHFKDDIDLLEQQRFRHRYQRKLNPGEPDVITVQDVKDIALYTAPVNLLNSVVINALHLPTTEQFLRALILYCQYFLQVADIMTKRMAELELKLRTPQCDITENEYRDNLSDLRLLTGKVYCSMIMGAKEMKNFHHMGPHKRKSLINRDARFFETLIRLSIQIVWLSLGRRSFNIIEVEVNRLFKSDIFNGAEHIVQTDYFKNMSERERSVLLGECLRHDKKLNSHSPFINEAFCKRHVDYRLLGLGVIKNDRLSPRLEYLRMAISAPEHTLTKHSVVVGILGQERSKYDIMLRVVPIISTDNAFDSKRSSATSASSFSMKKSISSTKKKSAMSNAAFRKMYPDIYIPPKCDNDDYFDPNFNEMPAEVQSCNKKQQALWLQRYHRLLAPPSRKSHHIARFV